MLVDCVLINHYHYFTTYNIKERIVNDKQNIVVVGAGYAGVSATKFLAKKFKNTDVTIHID